MKIKKITATAVDAYPVDAGECRIHPRLQLEAEIEEGDDLDECAKELQEEVFILVAKHHVRMTNAESARARMAGKGKSAMGGLVRGAATFSRESGMLSQQLANFRFPKIDLNDSAKKALENMSDAMVEVNFQGISDERRLRSLEMESLRDAAERGAKAGVDLRGEVLGVKCPVSYETKNEKGEE